MTIPKCGLYRTLVKIGDLDAGTLVYLHDHGNPGPGLYVPEGWTANRARFSPRGRTLPPSFDASMVMPLPREGYYRVLAPFHCCEKECMRFERDGFVQLGYNGKGRAILFVPELSGNTITVGDRGTIIDDSAFQFLGPLTIRESQTELSVPRGIVIH